MIYLPLQDRLGHYFKRSIIYNYTDMIAVIQTGGKQYIVEQDQMVKVERLSGNVGDTLTIDEVLFISEGGDKVKVGNPTVAGANVTAEIVDQGRAKKIRVVKYKNKIRYKRTLGHRQHFTQLKITSIKA